MYCLCVNVYCTTATVNLIAVNKYINIRVKMFCFCLRRNEEINEGLSIQSSYINCNVKVGAICKIV